MTTHTPGPWMVSKSEPLEILMDDSDGEQVFALVAAVCLENTTEEQAQADARLIAAAPDMLAALIGLVGNNFTDEELARRWSWSIEAIKAARAAMVKGEGKPWPLTL